MRLSFILFTIICFICPTNLFGQTDTIGNTLVDASLISFLKTNYYPSSPKNYNTARDSMFISIDVDAADSIRGVYTGLKVKADGSRTPSNGSLSLNTEHSWPQSFYDGGEPMKSDIHHLFPVWSSVNSSRGNHPFAEIADNLTSSWWYWENGGSVSSIPSQNIDSYSEYYNNSFEPREDHKGNAARAMFYFWTMYSDNSDIVNDDFDNSAFFEGMKSTLYNWHNSDPVNSDEVARSNAIYSVQGNKNPFIHDTTLVRRAYFNSSSTSSTTTTLSPGEIAIIGIAADDPDDFHFILLVDIESGTEIIFTDSGWKSDNTFRGNEGATKYTAPSALNAGTMISYRTNSANFASANDANVGTSGFSLSTSGDQVIAFQGTTSSPTFIYAAQLNSNQWQSTSDATTNSAIPQGLVDGVTAVAAGAGSGTEYDNAWYSGSTTANPSALLALISDNSNWTGNNSSYSPQTSFTLSTVDATITGDAGWRLLSLPKSGGTIADISDDSPVQGITGGSNTGSSSNFYIYDSDGAWEEPTNATTAWGDGYGFAMYFYNNTSNGSSALPVTLDADGLESISDVTVNLYGGAANRYTLVGNPFASNLNTNSITVSGGSIQNNISFWNDAGSTYSAQDRTGSYIIAPWQGFFVETSDASASSITIPTSAKTSSATSGTFFSKVADIRGDINFALSSETTNDEAIRLSFRANATPDWDLDDASKLTPLLTAYATLGFATNDMVKSVESLPYRLEEEVTLPMQLDLVGVEGEFSLGWDGLETIPDEWEFVLHDYEQGTSVNLRDIDEYTFEAEPEVASKRNPLTILTMPGKAISKTTQDNRFAITIQPSSVANELNSKPFAFNLEQNYPNPFNPSTVITFDVKDVQDVKLQVFDISGRLVKTLVNNKTSPGRHQVVFDASNLSSGIYLLRMQAGYFIDTKKITLIK